MDKVISTTWHAQNELLVTTLSGIMNDLDIKEWELTLANAMQIIPDHSSFRILVNQHGFQAANMDVHKQYRTIMPLFLAAYGYRIGYLDMFPEAVIDLRTTRDIRCTAMANVHHNADKMNDYEERFSSDHERYFTIPEQALEWLTNLKQTPVE